MGTCPEGVEQSSYFRNKCHGLARGYLPLFGLIYVLLGVLYVYLLVRETNHFADSHPVKEVQA